MKLIIEIEFDHDHMPSPQERQEINRVIQNLKYGLAYLGKMTRADLVKSRI